MATISLTFRLLIGFTFAGIMQPLHGQNKEADSSKFLNQPLVRDIYTADPSAHIFEGKIYIYPSHDIDAGIKENDNGDQFAMRDYHVYSMEAIPGNITDHGVGLDIRNIPWAAKQLWAPDAAYKNGGYYLYFPVKDKNNVFRIGVATSFAPAGPFKAELKAISGSFSVDPAVFTDGDGSSYMYFGGLRGGQLEKRCAGEYDSAGREPADEEPALAPKMAKMSRDMLQFAEPPRDVQILDRSGKPLLAKDHDKRFFEGSWMHRDNGRYYFTYSTGDTHYLAYATADNPYGPFTYQGTFLKPVQGWTTHHSIVKFKGKWFMFYHDTQLSGKTHLRNIKVTELVHNADGSIQLIDPFVK
jgi:hypothetical protein